VSIVTLKRRKPGVVREVPVPWELFAALRRVGAGTSGNRLLPWHRATAWRKVRTVLADAGITGAQAMPKGLRHGFGVNAIQCGVPLNLLAKWMGHADMKTTAIYANATGPEERRIAARMWSVMTK
jgi:integrase